MTVRTEFPAFPVDAIPALPDGWTDSSWHNDVCPSYHPFFMERSQGLDDGKVFCAYAQAFFDWPDPADRELENVTRYTLFVSADHAHETGVHIPCADSDNWQDVLDYWAKNGDAIRIACRFAQVLSTWMTPAQWGGMKAKHASPEWPANCCASHDYYDSNMAMHEAFMDAMGMSEDEFDIGSQEQADLWNAAWDIAATHFFGRAAK